MTRPAVAIVGASADRSKFGNKAVRAFRQQGFDVYPVNPRGGQIEGLDVFRRLADVPQPLERVSVYLPPTVVLELLPEIAAAKPQQVWLNPGSDSPEVVAAARALGIEPIVACSIVAIGVSPGDFS
jgi:predicted CoA-binding protein